MYTKQYEMDKYYHSKANCEATQTFGELGEEAITDSERDQVANRLGRERGRKYRVANAL